MATPRAPAASISLGQIVATLADTNHSKPTGTPSNLKAAVVKTRIYALPDDASPQLRSTVLTVLTTHGQSKSTDVRKWKSWILSFYCICYPELVELCVRRNPREYEVSNLTQDVLDEWVNVFDAVDASEEDYYDLPFHPHPSFPDLDDPLLSTYRVACNSLDGLYCYASLLLFLAGKAVTPINRNTITTKRPRALMDEFQTHDSEYILSGNGRIQDTGHQMIHAAWTASVDPRIDIVEHFASTMGVSSTPYRIIGHTLKLMRLNGMNYVSLIVRFLEAFEDYLGDLPQLRSDLRSFKDSAARWETIDPTIRPFYKFAYGNECTLFRRRDMAGLVACGIVFGASTSETLKNYRIDPGYSALMNRVARVAAEHDLDFTRSADQAVVTHAL